MGNAGRIIIIFLFVSLVPCTYAFADQLKKGLWEGTMVFEETVVKVEYNVSYGTQNEDKTPQIEMVYLGYEPRKDYVRMLGSIEIKGDAIKFNIPEGLETKQCTLTIQKNNKYSGECKSDKATNGETSKLTMAPVAE